MVTGIQRSKRLYQMPPLKYSTLVLAMMAANETMANSCLPGTYEPAPGAECVQAAKGYYVATAGATAPTIAPAGTFISTVGATAATPAPVGTFVATQGATSAIRAPAGSFVATQGATSATRAPVGTFVATQGASKATLAPAGTFVSTQGATNATRASAGTFVATQGASKATLAPVGMFVATQGATSATRAPAGTFVATQGATSATPAPAGSFVAVQGASSATLAPIGMFVATQGATTAVPAPAGSFVASQGATSATLAPAGYYVASAGQTAAVAAPSGTFVSSQGATAPTDCAGDSSSYGASVACRAGRDVVDNTVSPEFSSNYGLGGSFDLGLLSLNQEENLSFDIFNLSSDLGFSSPLTDLSILNIVFEGTHSDMFSIDNFLNGMVLHEGEAKGLALSLNSSMMGAFNVNMLISTDQSAALGESGEVFTYNFWGQVGSVEVPEPSAFMLLLTGLLGLFRFRKKLGH